MKKQEEKDDYQQLAIGAQNMAGKFIGVVMHELKNGNAAAIEALVTEYDVDSGHKISCDIISDRLIQLEIPEEDIKQLEAMINIILSFGSMHTAYKVALAILKEQQNKF